MPGISLITITAVRFGRVEHLRHAFERDGARIEVFERSSTCILRACIVATLSSGAP